MIIYKQKIYKLSLPVKKDEEEENFIIPSLIAAGAGGLIASSGRASLNKTIRSDDRFADSVTLYHGTPERNHENIKKHGLLGARTHDPFSVTRLAIGDMLGDKDIVYLNSSKDLAGWYGDTLTVKVGKRDYKRKFEPKRIMANPEFMNSKSFNEYLSRINAGEGCPKDKQTILYFKTIFRDDPVAFEKAKMDYLLARWDHLGGTDETKCRMFEGNVDAKYILNSDKFSGGITIGDLYDKYKDSPEEFKAAVMHNKKNLILGVTKLVGGIIVATAGLLYAGKKIYSHFKNKKKEFEEDKD